MSRSTKTSRWRQRIDGAKQTGPPTVTQGSIARLSLGLIALVMAATPVLVAPAAAITADGEAPISIAYCIDCVPFQFQDENGEPAGMIIDLSLTTPAH